MKGLTLTQPWATLVAIGAKRIETRSWATSYRGLLAIHAAKGFPGDAQWLCLTEPFNTVLTAAGFPEAESQIPRGAIVAMAQLADCVRISFPEEEACRAIARQYAAGQHEKAFGDFTWGRYMWLLRDVEPLREPVPCRGYQGLWPIEGELLRQVEQQIGVNA